MSASMDACIARHVALLSPPLPKMACITTPAAEFEVGESFAAGAVRQRTNEFEIRFEEAQDDRSLLRDRVNTLFIDKPDHCHTSMLLDRETIYTRKAWAGSKDRSAAIVAHVRTLEAQVAALIAQTSSLQTQLTIALGRIEILETRDLEPQEGPAEAGSNG
nr:hypothetical protein [Tanacetum cinerariifolium]